MYLDFSCALSIVLNGAAIVTVTDMDRLHCKQVHIKTGASFGEGERLHHSLFKYSQLAFRNNYKITRKEIPKKKKKINEQRRKIRLSKYQPVRVSRRTIYYLSYGLLGLRQKQNKNLKSHSYNKHLVKHPVKKKM